MAFVEASKEKVGAVQQASSGLWSQLRESFLKFVSNKLSDHEREIFVSELERDGGKEGVKATEQHPVFGELLHDFGYKKVYASCPRQIREGVPVWERQRVFREERAQEIANAITGSEFGVPGVITIFAHPSKESSNYEEVTGVVDGQHRLGGLQIMATGGTWPLDWGTVTGSRILTEVYPLSGSHSVEALFTQINQAEPVKLIDMPGAQMGEEEEDEAEEEGAGMELTAEGTLIEEKAEVRVEATPDFEQVQVMQGSGAVNEEVQTSNTTSTTPGAEAAVVEEEELVRMQQQQQQQSEEEQGEMMTEQLQLVGDVTEEQVNKRSNNDPASDTVITTAVNDAQAKQTKGVRRRSPAAAAAKKVAAQKQQQQQREAVNIAAERLRAQFPAMFKPNSRCRVPHLHLDNLRDALFRSPAVARLLQRGGGAQEEGGGGVVLAVEEELGDVLTQWLLDHNERLRHTYTTGQRKTRAKKALARCEEAGLFLGLDSAMTWLEEEEEEED